MSDAVIAPVADGCPNCGRSDFTSGSGKTLHIKACKGPQKISPDKCPRCDRTDFSSASGKTLHIKACKGGAKQLELETPCPKCRINEFNSLSGRTLHIKACGEKQEVEKPVPVKEIKQKDFYCSYCKKDVFGYERTFINHLNQCYPIAMNGKGHIFDKRLKIWVKKAPAKCYCTRDLLEVLKCWPPKLGISHLDHADIRDQTGCWLEGIGQCVYSYDVKSRNKMITGKIDRKNGEMVQEGAPPKPQPMPEPEPEPQEEVLSEDS